jgi:hypothetical protein
MDESMQERVDREFERWVEMHSMTEPVTQQVPGENRINVNPFRNMFTDVAVPAQPQPGIVIPDEVAVPESVQVFRSSYDEVNLPTGEEEVDDTW